MSRQHQPRDLDKNQAGWSTLELILTMPILALMLYALLFVTQYGLARLQLMSLVDSLARQAAISGCGSVDGPLNDHMPARLALKSSSCGGSGEMIKLEVVTELQTSVPIAVTAKRVSSTSYAWNENDE